MKTKKVSKKKKLHKPWNRFHIMATRFDRKTWMENVNFCNSKNIKGALYGSKVRVSKDVPLHDYLFVVEMLNIPRGENGWPGKIMGIGLVHNKIEIKKRYTIYSDTNYNRYIYRSKYRIGRECLDKKQLKTIQYIEKLIFYGKTHIKRGVGISRIPPKLISEKKKSIKKFLCSLFSNIR